MLLERTNMADSTMVIEQTEEQTDSSTASKIGGNIELPPSPSEVRDQVVTPAAVPAATPAAPTTPNTPDNPPQINIPPPPGQGPPDGQGPGGPVGPEAPNLRNPEWENSPEYGRTLVEYIVHMETKVPYEIRYNEVNGSRLDRAYKALLKFVEGEQEHRYDKNPFNPQKGHPKVEQQRPGETLLAAMIRTYKERIAQGVAKASQEAQRPPDPEDFTDVEDLADLITRLNSIDTTPDQMAALKEPLLKYFREAQRKGLLKGIDEIFNGLYMAYSNRSLPPARIKELLYEKTVIGATPNIPEAYIDGEGAYRRKMTDREVNPRLRQVWDAYITLARQRFDSILAGEEPATPEVGEWRPPTEQEMDETTETYWEPSANYPKYYSITANTPSQFRIARETFLRMIKNKALGYAPDELMQHFLNFRDNMCARAEDIALRQAAEEALALRQGREPKVPEGPERMTTDFVVELRQEFEAEAFIWGADYHNEVYNKDGWKQFMMAMALHEGPQRWTRLIRSGEGQVGVHTYWLDYDKMVEFAYNAQGSRGQLGKSSVAQNYLRETVIEMLVERGTGVVLKDYDPSGHRDNFMNGTDAQSNQLRFERALYLHQIEQHLRRNNYDLSSLNDDARKFYQELKEQQKNNKEFIGLHNSKDEVRALFEGFDKGDAHLINFKRYGVGADGRKLPDEQYKRALEALPPPLRRSVDLGGIQQAIADLRQEVRSGAVTLKRGETLIGKLEELRRIDKKDRRLYEDRRALSRFYFDIAFQMQGATQEKAIRGGAVLFVGRNPFRQAYREVRKSDDNQLSPAERMLRWNREQHIGWILSEIEIGTMPDTLSPEEQLVYQTYQRLNNAEKKDFRDEIPFHLAVKFVQAGVNWMKMHYADDAQIWNRPDLAVYIHAKDEKGNYQYPNFRACFRTAMVNEIQNYAIGQLATNGYQATLNYTDFEVVSFDPKTKKIVVKRRVINPQTGEEAPVRPMTIKIPTGTINADGKMDVSGFEEKQLAWDDTDTTVDASNTYLALHTTHTYWAYQNNNTHTITPEYVFQQARDIRDGKLRWEDADILAGLLLTVDPTLCRVKSFPGKQMALETLVFDAAVEDSYLSWVKIRNGLKAKFLPRDGNHEWMDMGYYIEDFGGEARFALQIEALVAKMPKRWARRFAAALDITPQHASSLADNVGRKGVTGWIAMMADKVKDLSGQAIVGQFSIIKGINLVDSASELWAHLVGFVDPKTGLHHEGVFMKPTNNNDKLVQFWTKVKEALQNPSTLNDFLYNYKDSFGRIEDVLKIIRKMYSDQRNAGGALYLLNTDFYLPNGRFNPEIAKDRNTGTSRHIAKMFWDAYVEWLVDPGPGGGVETYGESAAFYKFLKEPYLYWDGQSIVTDPDRTWADWLFDKMAL